MYSGKSQGSLFVLIESDWSCKIGKWRIVTSSTIYNPTWFNLFSFLHFCLFVTAKQSNYYVTLISYFAQENGWHSPSFWHNYWLFTRASCCLLFTNISGKSSWKVNRTRLFGSFQRNIFRSNGTSKKVVLFFRTEFPKKIVPEIRVPFLHFSVNAPVRGDIYLSWTLLYHLSKPLWTERYAQGIYLVNNYCHLFWTYRGVLSNHLMIFS